jgi:hypothetical protein
MFIWIPSCSSACRRRLLPRAVLHGAVLRRALVAHRDDRARHAHPDRRRHGARARREAGHAAVIVCGAPSAISIDVFNNQDWVWGLALMLAGLFVALAAREYGVQRLADDFVNTTPGSWRAGRLYVWIVSYLVPVQVVLMFSWWMYQAIAVIDPTGWWHPLHVYSVGTCLVQWGLALALLIAWNRKIAARQHAGRQGGRGMSATTWMMMLAHPRLHLGRLHRAARLRRGARKCARPRSSRPISSRSASRSAPA